MIKGRYIESRRDWGIKGKDGLHERYKGAEGNTAKSESDVQ